MTIQAGVIIVWPDGLMYDLFRKQFTLYTCYTSILQFLQFNYQQGCLYRLRALGERHKMDITIVIKLFVQFFHLIRRLPIMDVERSKLSVTIPVHWLLLYLIGGIPIAASNFDAQSPPQRKAPEL
ncbi:UNVERIFIED_CONTAM: transmembrane protein [Trichonephila clavipes]